MRKLFLLLMLMAVLLLSILLFQKNIPVRRLNDTATSTFKLFNEVRERVAAPLPLIFEKDTISSYLSKEKILEETNSARQAYGLPLLKEKEELNLSAFMKVRDIFERQYFSHISPLGQEPSYLVQEAGYEFVAIGENLALGGFADEKELISAWMQSPGHKENIISKNYRDIGVAVLK